MNRSAISFHRPRSPWLLMILTLAGCVLAGLATVAGAGTITWNNPAGGLWSDAANWSPQQVPGAAGDVAVLPALSGAYLVTLDIDPAIDALQLAAGDPTLDLNGHSVLSVPSVTNSGTIVNFVGTYDSDQIHNLTGGTVTGAPNQVITVPGGKTLTNDGRIVVGPGAASALYASTIDGAGSVVLNQSLLIGGGLTFGSGVTVSGSGVIDASGGTGMIRNGGTITSDGTTIEIHGVIYNSGTLRVLHGGTLHMTLGGLVKNTGGNIESGPGGGTFSAILASGNSGTIDFLTGGKLVVNGGDLHLSCGMLLEPHIERVGTTGAVVIGIATFQNCTVAAGAELSVPGQADFMASVNKIQNDGIVRVGGRIDFGGTASDSIAITGSGTVILENGKLGFDPTTSNPHAACWNTAGMTIQGCGTIYPPFINDGVVSLDCGEQLPAGPGLLVNRGTMRVMGRKFAVSGDGFVVRNRGSFAAVGGMITVDKGGVIDNSGGLLVTAGQDVLLGSTTTSGTVIGGTLAASGAGLYRVQKAATLTNITLGDGATLLTQGGATTTVTGSRFTNRGTSRVATGGALALDAATDYVQTAGSTALEGGTISAARDLQIQGGELRGIGTVAANVVNAGHVNPDVGTTPIYIQGNYIQTSGGSFQAALSGASLSNRLAVSGNASLDGVLATSVADGFIVTGGTSFNVLSYGSVSGEFSQMTGGSSANGELNVAPVYGPGSLALVVSAVAGVNHPAVTPTTLRFYGRRVAGGSEFVLELPRDADLSGRVYDASGREVARLADGAHAAGVYVFALRGAGGPAGLPSGLYFARMQMLREGVNETRSARVVLVH